MSSTTQKPQKKFRINHSSSAVFVKESKKGKPVMSVSIQKSTKDKAGEWTNATIWLYPHELPALIAIAQKMYQHCLLNESE